MIKLQVEPYCQNCQDFKPTADTFSRYAGNVVVQCDTIVSCEYKDRCAAVAKFLEEK